jgi:hypothetical protein
VSGSFPSLSISWNSLKRVGEDKVFTQIIKLNVVHRMGSNPI